MENEKKKFTDRFSVIKEKVDTKTKKRLIKLVILLVLILVVTNPGLIPFLPASIKNTLVSALSALFGNVTAIYKVIAFSWITLFQLIVMIIALVIISIVYRVVLDVIEPEGGRLKTLVNLIRSLTNYIFVIIGIFWGLAIIGLDLSTIIASLGIIALIIGFGAESLIADLVTGIFMIFENEYNTGDVVELNGFIGTVTSMGIRNTCITSFNGDTMVVNNADMRNVINRSQMESRAICDFPIPYEVKIADAETKLQTILDRIPETYPDIFIKKPQYKGVQELAGSAVILRVIAFVSEKNRFDAARILNRELKSGMEDMGISCPFTQVVVHKANDKAE